ncbi:hypothetical protein SAMN05444336_112104 [Albimonas donghaensis]|uniref:Uncharacterized protein n=1 Tax=Albimonas donghaensis TaxID=356660 RepID=A0A1H3FIU6_9RHOB|nr:hypothetical protein [Albimonas donghaensis]SDX90019.1 hypothetical protein SAMN05444336_112104 [Albimonas donghaensis]
MIGNYPLYPVAIGTRLKADWIPLHHERLLGSRFAATVDPAAGFYGMMLWARAAVQDPAGTLPTDDVELAFLAGFGRDLAGWEAVRGGALYGWEPMICLPPDEGATIDDGVVRLGHPFLVKVIAQTLQRLSDSRASSQRGSERALRSRLKRIMREKCGAHAGLTERDDYVSAVMAFLHERDLRWRADNVARAMAEVSLREDRARANAQSELAEVANIMRSRRPVDP